MSFCITSSFRIVARALIVSAGSCYNFERLLAGKAMEGERILKELKTADLPCGEEAAGAFLKRATDYLAPLFHKDDHPTQNAAVLAKLEVFSIKLFKLSLERAKSSQRTTEESTLFIDLCQLAVSSLQVCAGSSSGKIPPLSFEKLLLHFLQLSAARREFGNVLNACRVLRKRLGGERGEEEGKKEERDTLLKHAFDLTWKAALSEEQKTHAKKVEISDENSCNGEIIAVAELCLQLREEAFACLLTVPETNGRFVLERLMRSSQRYQQIMTVNSAQSPQYFEQLHSFHTHLLSIRDIPSLSLSPSADIFLGVDYLCHLSRLARSAGHTHQAEVHLARAKEASTACSDGEREGKSDDHCATTKENLKSLLSALVHLTSVLITLEAGYGLEEEEKLCENVQTAAREMERGVESTCHSSQLTRLFEAVEQLFLLLRQRRAATRERGEDPCSLLPRGVFPGLASLVTSQVKVGERRERRKEDGDRANQTKETQWLRKTSFLVDCLREAGYHGDVMETVASVARGLPGWVVCDDGEGVEVMVGMWVRGKKELASRRPDSPSLEQWRHRSFLSLIPPASPPLSTRHKSHILTAELVRLTGSGGHMGRLINQNAVAVGYELVEVYREGGWEWDVERGRVMVDLATTDSSLLNEAIELMEGVVSGRDHTHPAPRRRKACLNLASALVLKAICVLQDRMRSCDVGGKSHDQPDGSHDPGSKSHDQEEWLCEGSEVEGRGEVEECLGRAVDRWCEWGEGGEGEGEGEEERVLHFLRLTAELCHLTCQFVLAGRCLWILDKIRHRHLSVCSLPPVYQTALSACCQLQIRGGFARHDFCSRDLEARLCEVAQEVGEERGSEVKVSSLSCRLVLASLHLEQREFEKCRSELVRLFSEPLLSRHTVSTHTLTAGTRLTTARLLLTRHTPLLPLRPFLSRLITEEATEAPTPGRGGKGLTVTPLELVSAAVKTLSSLFDHLTSAGSKEREGEEVAVWGVLGRLLESLLCLSRLHLQQGAVREALYYAREGGSLAKMMRLQPWHEKFVGVATDVHKTRGDPQAPPVPLLLPPPSLFSSPFTLTSPDQLHSTLTEAESLINQSNPSHALTLCEELIQSSSEDQESDLAQAWLHLMAGRAVVEDVALTRPVLLEDLWGEAAGSSRRRNKGRGGGRRGVKVLGWLSLVPESFQKALGHFCTALQLCHPASPPQPLREVYRWLSVVLSPYHPSLAAHCLLCSSHLSLAHKATAALGKKIRKQSHEDSSDHRSFQDVMMALQDSSEGCPEISDPLVQAREVLRPSVAPPPLSHTLSLLSSLPDGCQFNIISLAPTLICQPEQEHLLLCVVGKNREPLFVKSPVEGQKFLSRFSSMIAESEASMKLSEKRKWWSIRRKLDRQMKEFVSKMQTEWLGEHVEIFGPPPPTPGGTTGYHLLCIGRLVQHLPWEAVPVFQDQPVGRVPSLSFAVAHQILQTGQKGWELDPGLGYYVLNPRGDLPDTEKRFHGWFEKELRWRGVVGHAPSSTQFSEALQSHDVFVYCGHGTGREFLSTDHFQQLSCQATTLLMGCGSGRLVVGGACDPAGMALNYLLAGCPSLVAVLWDVTDGDIDRLSKSLLEQWLEGEEEEEEEEEEGEEEGEDGERGEGMSLSLALARARSVCKLEGLNGYAAILYGNPSIAVT